MVAAVKTMKRRERLEQLRTPHTHTHTHTHAHAHTHTHAPTHMHTCRDRTHFRIAGSLGYATGVSDHG